MKTIDSIIFFLAVGLFIIGIHQAIVIGISESYWIFMFSLALLFLYGYRKNKLKETEPPPKKKSKNKKR